MRIAVIGAGAMGSIYAALLSEAGHDVWAVDPNVEHVNAINRDGLRLEGPHGSRTYRQVRAVPRCADVADAVRALGTPALEQHVPDESMDWVILATKATHVPEAVRDLAPIVSKGTTVLAMQNGLGAAERVLDNLPAEDGTRGRPHVALGVAQGFGAALVGPGAVQFANMKLMRFGEIQDGESEVMKAVAEVWQAAGFQAQAFPSLSQLIWEKFICNVTLSGPCTVFGRSVGAMKAIPEQWAIALRCGLEAFEVGKAQGVLFSFTDAEAYISEFAESVGEAKPSMLQDFEAGRRSEIDVINGRVPIEGDRVGMETPWNAMITEIVRAKEAALP